MVKDFHKLPKKTQESIIFFIKTDPKFKEKLLKEYGIDINLIENEK
jgi:hypothetical protein